MKRVILLGLCLGALSTQGFSQENKKQQDIKSIKDMCGCYKVTFNYTETFSPEIDYEKKLDYTSGAYEWAEAIEETPNKVSIQHLLVLNDTMVIKHWRQDWLYENRNVFEYNKDNQWIFSSLPKEQVKGQWTQKVFQVDDSPRYSGSATWVHFDGKNYWENRTDSPLPRREHSKRSDYNVLSRGNRQEITKEGWVHVQDNDKIIREDGKEDVLLVQEKGYNTYVKVDDALCKAAKDWWKEHKDFWAKARDSWDRIYDREGALTLRNTVDDKPLFRYLAPLEAKNASKKDIHEVLEKFIIKDNVPDDGKSK